MKRVLLFLSLLVFAAGCSLEPPQWAQGGGSSGDDDDVVIGLSVSTLNNPFFVTLKDGLEAAAEEKGDEVIVVDVQYDSANQVNDVADMMQDRKSLPLN